jgi:hypothetical protein
MAVVAVMAALIGIGKAWYNSLACVDRADAHGRAAVQERWNIESRRESRQGGSRYPFATWERRADYHEAMQRKWLRAAAHPWELVEPDGPAPP